MTFPPEIYDTTLRDGAQGAGVSFSPSAAARLVRALDEFGVDYIEGVLPSSPAHAEAFYAPLRALPLRHAVLAAFGATCHVGAQASSDPGLLALLAAQTPVVTLFGKASRFHVDRILQTTPDENLRIVSDSVSFLRHSSRDVFFDAEHFFDGFAADPDYALAVLDAAAAAGASRLVLCDTNGGSLPSDVSAAVAAVRARFPSLPVGIHAHNDSSLAVAVSLAARSAGATHFQGSLNGIGERVGNTDLCSLLPLLALKLGDPLACAPSLPSLRSLSRLLDELLDRRPDPSRPLVGDHAFTHKAGMHADAVAKIPSSFEHIDPAAVGNTRHIPVSALSGRDNVRAKTSELGVAPPPSDPELESILRQIKWMEADGYQFETADASFRLLIEKAMGRHVPFFELRSFHVGVVKSDASSPPSTIATVKVAVNGREELGAGEGAGPVDALNSALRLVLRRFYPALDAVVLQDYHVRILDPETATRAVTRVVIESTDGTHTWGTVGVSPNIIEASWQALVDSFEYKLLLDARSRAASPS